MRSSNNFHQKRLALMVIFVTILTNISWHNVLTIRGLDLNWLNKKTVTTTNTIKNWENSL